MVLSPQAADHIAYVVQQELGNQFISRPNIPIIFFLNVFENENPCWSRDSVPEG
jgi:hypothetical protein